MSDIVSKATVVLEEPNKMNFLKRVALIGVLACSTLLVISLTSSTIQTNQVASPMTLDAQPYVETKGRQPIKNGCVNLYGSDWAQYPNTRAVVVCNDATQGFLETQIDNVGFSHDSVNHGISYVETGDDATVVLYTENDYMGESLLIKPNSKVWLEQVGINGGSTKWNDKVRSVYFQGHSGSLVTQIVDIYSSDIPVCADHCVMLYASDPYDPVGAGGTTCVVICGDPLKQKVWKYSYGYIQSQGYPLKLYSLGVSYIQVGAETSAQMFSGPNFDENSEYLKSGQNYDLTKMKYPEVGHFPDGWNDKPMSFILTLGDVN